MSDTTALAKDGKLYDIPNDKVGAALEKGFEKTYHMTKEGKSYDIPSSKVQNAMKSGFASTSSDGYIDKVKEANAEVNNAAGKGITGVAKKLVGGAETDLSIASSVIAPAAGFISASLEKSGGANPKEVKEAYDRNKENFTYEPKTETGKAISKTVGSALEPVGAIVDFPGKFAERITSALGLDENKSKLLHEIITDFLPAIAGPEAKGAVGTVAKATASQAEKVAGKIAEKAVAAGIPEGAANFAKKSIELAVEHKLSPIKTGAKVADKASNRAVLSAGKYQALSDD